MAFSSDLAKLIGDPLARFATLNSTDTTNSCNESFIQESELRATCQQLGLGVEASDLKHRRTGAVDA